MNRTPQNNYRILLLSFLLAFSCLLVACSPESQGGSDKVAPVSTPANNSVSSPASTQTDNPTGVPVTVEGEVVGPSGADLTSEDGLLSLTIPAGALAKDVPINIEALPTDQWTGFLAGLDPAAIVYSLEPSGLTFDQPVAFQMSMEIETGEDGSVVPPLAFVINGDGNGELIDLDVQLDNDSGIAILSGTIEHFSMIVVFDGGLAVGLEQVNPKERNIGSPWEAGVVVRNITKKPAGVELSIAVNTIRYESLGEVEVVGASSHHSFNLNSGEERKLDLPAPRWQCGDEGDGSYRVVVSANLGGNLISDLVQWRSEVPVPSPLPWESFSGNKQSINFVVLAEAPVVCVIPEYQASTQSGNISISGRVSDVNKSYTLTGSFQGGSAKLTFIPDLVPLDGNLSPGGSYSYTGGGSGATVSGKGSYTLAGTLGQPLTLRYSAHGCADPGKCADTDVVILLTPIDP